MCQSRHEHCLSRAQSLHASIVSAKEKEARGDNSRVVKTMAELHISSQVRRETASSDYTPLHSAINRAPSFTSNCSSNASNRERRLSRSSDSSISSHGTQRQTMKPVTAAATALQPVNDYRRPPQSHYDFLPGNKSDSFGLYREASRPTSSLDEPDTPVPVIPPPKEFQAPVPAKSCDAPNPYQGRPPQSSQRQSPLYSPSSHSSTQSHPPVTVNGNASMHTHASAQNGTNGVSYNQHVSNGGPGYREPGGYSQRGPLYVNGQQVKREPQNSPRGQYAPPTAQASRAQTIPYQYQANGHRSNSPARTSAAPVRTKQDIRELLVQDMLKRRTGEPLSEYDARKPPGGFANSERLSNRQQEPPQRQQEPAQRQRGLYDSKPSSDSLTDTPLWTPPQPSAYDRGLSHYDRPSQHKQTYYGRVHTESQRPTYHQYSQQPVVSREVYFPGRFTCFFLCCLSTLPPFMFFRILSLSYPFLTRQRIGLINLPVRHQVLQ